MYTPEQDIYSSLVIPVQSPHSSPMFQSHVPVELQSNNCRKLDMIIFVAAY